MVGSRAGFILCLLFWFVAPVIAADSTNAPEAKVSLARKEFKAEGRPAFVIEPTKKIERPTQ